MSGPKPDTIYFQSRGFPEFRFLSNFHISPIVLDKKRYESVEHAYQCMKACNDKDFQFLYEAKTPGEAKRRGRQVTLPVAWEETKDAFMEIIVRAKFRQNETLKEMLLATEDVELVEFAPWGDTYWGVDKNYEGENRLGKILMKVREEMRAK